MTVRLLVIAVAMAWLTGQAGCGDGHRQAVRQVTIETEEQEPANVQTESPHGMRMPTENPHVASVNESATQAPPGGTEPEKVELAPVHLTAPKSWARKAPRSGFILAEFALPKAEGDAADGRLTVSTAGGTVENNIERWRGQFVDKPEKDKREQLKVDDVDVTLVDLSGTFSNQMGPMSPATNAPGYRMIGGVFAAGGQLYFIKATGPEKTIAAREEEIRGFVKSLKVDKAK